MCGGWRGGRQREWACGMEGMLREAGRWDKRRKEKRKVIREGREKKEWERSAEE